MSPSAAAPRLASLDGLRAVSIALVLFGHLLGTRGFLGVSSLGRASAVGVKLFFVISGFLITTLLLQEHERTGTVSLRRFYLRRTFRIFPAFYAFLGVVLCLSWISALELREHDLLTSALYLVNYHHERSWWIGHLWSLSVEEQFYVLWPLAVVVLRPRGSILLAAFVILAVPIARVTIWMAWPELRVGIGETFPTVCDALATGCLLAGLRGWMAQVSAIQRFLASPWFFLVVPIGVLAIAVSDRPRVSLWIGDTMLNVVLALVVARWTSRPGDLVGRFLNARPVIAVGVASYSLYLWQQPFLNRHAWGVAQSFPLNLLLAVAAALASYHLVEKPFLRLRARFESWLLPPMPLPGRPGAAGIAAAVVSAPEPGLGLALGLGDLRSVVLEAVPPRRVAPRLPPGHPPPHGPRLDSWPKGSTPIS